MLPVIVLDRGLKTCFFNWFVFYCKTNYVQCSSSSTCLRRGNYIGSSGSCPLLRQLCQYPCCVVVCWRVKDSKLQQSPPCIQKCPFQPRQPHTHAVDGSTHSGDLVDRMNTWMHIKRNLSLGVVGTGAFWLCQGSSEITNEGPKILRGFETFKGVWSIASYQRTSRFSLIHWKSKTWKNIHLSFGNF